MERAVPDEKLIIEYRNINRENEYLRKLVEECKENNRTLRENNKLLSEKITLLEQTCNKKSFNEITKENINTNLNPPLRITSRQTAEHSSASELRAPKPKLNLPSQKEVGVNNANNPNPNSVNINKQAGSSTINMRDEKWNKVKPRRTRTIGTAEIKTNNENSTTFQGRNTEGKKLWLFISKIKTGVTEEIIKNYLTEKLKPADQEPVIVRKINTYHKTTDNECFQIGLDLKHKDKVYECTFWPIGVAFARFRFNYNKSQTQNTTQDPNFQQGTKSPQPK